MVELNLDNATIQAEKQVKPEPRAFKSPGTNFFEAMSWPSKIPKGAQPVAIRSLLPRSNHDPRAPGLPVEA